MAYEIISQNNSTTTLADENGNVITVPSRSILEAGTTFTLVKINNNTATLEDSNGNVYRDIPCCIDLTQVTGFNVTKVNNNKATVEDGDGKVYAGVPCIVNLTESGGGGSAVIDPLNVTPSTSAQTITATGGVDGYSPVNVSAVDASIDANITAGNIKSGVTILGVTGNVVELNGETKTVTPQVYGQTLYPTSPKNAITEIIVNAVTSSIDANITAGNIKKDVTILGVTGTYEGGGGGSPQYYLKKKVETGELLTDTSYCTDLTGVSSLGSYVFFNAFAYGTIMIGFGQTYCAPFATGSGITAKQYSIQAMFQWASFTNVNFSFDGITVLEDYAATNVLMGSNVEKVYFHGLTTINTNSLGSGTSGAFRSCVSLTEIHFPAALQADVEATSGYSAKWGATNATVYFDL